MALTKTPIELSSTPGIVDNSNATAITIDASENVGIGVSPEAWNTYTPLQVQLASLSGYTNGDSRLSNNAYYAGGWKYINSIPATQYLMDAANGVHTWSTAASGTADAAITWQERMRIDSSGNLILKKNLVLESTSEGIDFSGVGSSSQTLDDYEEGTWTPTPSTGGFSTSIATYTRVGRLVTARFFCLFNSAGSGSSHMLISGLPFNVINSNSGYAPGLLMVDNLTTAQNNITIQPVLGTGNFLFIIGNNSTGDHAGAPATLFSNSSSLRGTLVYETA